MSNEVIEPKAPVAEVTVLEDRAQVVRRGAVGLSAGLNQLVVSGVAPTLVDKSVSVSLGNGAALVDARVERRRVILPEQKAPELRALEAQVDEARLRKGELEEQRGVLRDRLSSLETIRGVVLEELAADVGYGKAPPADASERLARLSARIDEARAAYVEVGHALAEIDRAVADLEARRAAQSTPAQVVQADLHLTVNASQAGATELELSYLVPSAAWRPYHTARLQGGKVLFRSDACVWQASGEDWTGVKLWLSTERASLGTKPPPLSTDQVRSRKKGPEVAVEMREQAITTAGLGAAAKKVVEELPGIDDGGEARRLTAREVAHVPSDGRPYRIALFELVSPAKVGLVLKAELAAQVILRAELAHTGDRPILPGPVDLIRDGGLAGRTKVGFVAPGERFELGFGPDPSLRVRREVERLDSESKLLSAWTTTPHRVTVRLSNLGPEAKTVAITERVPVSEVEKVVIEPDPKATTDERGPDADGFVGWTTTLAPHGRRTITLAYSLRTHSSVSGI